YSGWEARIRMPSRAPLRHRPGDGLDVDQERLVFRRLDVGVADIGRQRVRAEALLRPPHKAPMQRYADDVPRLAVADQRSNPLSHDGFRLHRSALGPYPDPPAGLDILLLGKLFGNLDEKFRL